MTRVKPLDMLRNEGSDGNACPSYVHSRITLYHASKIDLRYCRTLHSCNSCRLGQVEDLCGAVHFGICAAVASPSPKLRRGSGASTSSALSPDSYSTKYSGPVYQSFANFASPTGGGTKSKIRSLAILREGHELAGMHLDNRPYGHHHGLMRLHPQRQVIVQGHNIRIGSGLRQPGSELIVSSGGRQGHSGGGGVAITIQRGQANITGGGNTDIKIQGSGHEIRIQGSGGQNIRVQPSVGVGGHAGHVIRIHGGHQGHAHYPPHYGARPVSVSPHIETIDSLNAPLLSTPKSYSSTKQFLPQKPTARVAPAPVPPPIVTHTNVYTPGTTMLSPPLIISPPCPSSPTFSQETPPFPVCSPLSSSPHTPASSPSPSPTPSSPSPVATVPPTSKQPVISVSNRDKEVGNNHVIQTAPKPTPDILKGRQDGIIKDVSGHTNTDGLLLHQANEVYPSNRKLHSKDVEILPQQPYQRLPETQPETTAKVSTKVDTRDKDNKVKKRSSRPVSNIHIPHFYFPMGKPGASMEIETALQKISQAFASLEGGKAYKQQMGTMTKACGLPHFWKILLFRAAGGTNEGYITYQSLSVLLRKLYQTCHDDASKFMRLAAKPGATALDFEDFEPLVQDVVETHAGLTFLQDAPEFHSRYVTTVISRIMFCVNRSWTGRITLPELRKSNFLPTLARLEEEEDINQIKDYFSYEHFYVIYCKFWELDKDHDLFIDKNDLSRHNDHALNSRLVDRIFSGAVTRGSDFQDGRMSYKEFVWFLLAEEDKRHPTSIEYWFRCMDLDGDGIISMYEMEYFHEEQMNKMETLGIERLPFEDTVCQMMDMVSPKLEGKITLSDLKACKMTNIFFDTFFNLDKFLEHEQRDPFANARDPGAEPLDVSDWNRYAEEEYDILVADEGNADIDEGNYEDDFEPEDDEELIRDEMMRLSDSGPPQRALSQVHTTDDIYDFSNTSKLGY